MRSRSAPRRCTVWPNRASRPTGATRKAPRLCDIPWVGDIRTLLETEDPQEFLDTLKLDFYQDEVFVLTPAGDVKTLPRGATAIDFAYAVHTEVGNRCVGVRINGRLLPLSTRLESGDIVEVLASKAVDAGPSLDWLNFVRTSRAKSKIKAFFLRERREQALAEGKELIATAFRKEGFGLGASARDAYLADIAARTGQDRPRNAAGGSRRWIGPRFDGRESAPPPTRSPIG